MEKRKQYPLYKGATRLPTVGGVPTMALLTMLICVASIAMLFSLWLWLFAPAFWFLMAQITKHDDKAFRVWWLWLDTKLRNRNKAFWGASTYSRVDYRNRRKR
jgi:type IV secretion system protein VirB3